MSLTCEMDFDGDCDWYYTTPSDFIALDTKRGRKCCSCGKHIKVGEQVLRFYRTRNPNNDIEERIYGDEVPMTTLYMCEDCGDLALNLNELGYCTPPGDDMRDLVKEYAEQRLYDADFKRGRESAMRGEPKPGDEKSRAFISGWNQLGRFGSKAA